MNNNPTIATTVVQPDDSFLQIADFVSGDTTMVTWQFAKGGTETITYQGKEALEQIAAIIKSQDDAAKAKAAE